MKSLNEIDLSKLEKIGRTGNVYGLNDDQILKVFSSEKQNSAKILDELQGLPFVPKIYEYGEDWLIMQRVHGNMMWFHQYGYCWFNVDFNYKEHKKNTLDFINGSMARGWMPDGLTSVNVLIDEDGKLWLCDVSRFKEIDSTVVVPIASKIDEYQQLLDYGKTIVNASNTVETYIRLVGREKLYEICHPTR